jgi:hypothetical protein
MEGFWTTCSGGPGTAVHAGKFPELELKSGSLKAFSSKPCFNVAARCGNIFPEFFQFADTRTGGRPVSHSMMPVRL